MAWKILFTILYVLQQWLLFSHKFTSILVYSRLINTAPIPLLGVEKSLMNIIEGVIELITFDISAYLIKVGRLGKSEK